jgi:transcriptional regulator with XRE-family HTH domain
LFPFGNLFMEIFISIGERLKKEREAMGKTQSDFAEIAAAAGVPGATRQSQAKYEKGLASPSAAYLSAIALRGVDVHYVLTGEREGPPPLVLSGEERLLLDYYRDAPPAVRKAAMAALLSGGAGGAAHFAGSQQVFHQAPKGDIAGRDIVKGGGKR